ncbi:phage head-tail joining protein [Photobacterium damselae]|uniref:phage head-tail joining protein n=1 Tax=Photobacterium damselae TaxID=38293 RepID=UPI001EFDAAAB|nr:hypothetical protein [Photobacterium damselae]MCG9780436.1 hypothetical protein [Photobacterium damselae]
MAYTKDDIDTLDEAIVSGELTVKINGREITYRSIDELLRVRRHVCRIIAKQHGIKSNPLSGIVTRLDRGIR